MDQVSEIYLLINYFGTFLLQLQQNVIIGAEIYLRDDGLQQVAALNYFEPNE